MRNRKADMPTLKVKNIQTYIDANQDYRDKYYIITPEGDFYLHEGIRIPAKQFEMAMPVIDLQRAGLDKGFRLDGRTNWID